MQLGPAGRQEGSELFHKMLVNGGLLADHTVYARAPIVHTSLAASLSDHCREDTVSGQENSVENTRTYEVLRSRPIFSNKQMNLCWASPGTCNDVL